jgi:NHL repeat-containing protein
LNSPVLWVLIASCAWLPASAAAQAPVYLMQWDAGGVDANNQVHYPTDVATDAAGNVFVMVTYENVILKFTGSGALMARWDLGSTSNLTGICTDPAGNVYVTLFYYDPDELIYDPAVLKYSGSGTLLTSWGSGGGGTGQFNNPQGVATDASGNVYVADAGNYRVQKFTSDGAYLAQWGTPALGIAIDAAGSVYVADGINIIRKFSDTGLLIGQWGSPGTGDGQFDQIFGIATDFAGDVYVSDYRNNRVQKFTSSGAYITQWGSLGSGSGQFHSPGGVATDAAGNIFVADARNYRVQKFGPDPTPTTSTSWGRLKTLYRP